MRNSTNEKATASEHGPSTVPPQRHISPLLISYAVNPVALAAMLVLREFDLVAHEPVWKYLAVLWGGAALASLTEIAYRRRPSVHRSWVRAFAQTACVTGAIYLTGWGPAMAVTYAFVAQETTGPGGSRSWRVTAAFSVCCIALAQIGISLGWVPSLLPEPLVHGLAALNALGVAMVVRMAGAVTEQKERAEASLRQSEDRFRSLVQNSSDLIMVLDHESRIAYTSEASHSVLGRSPEELLGLASATLVHPDDLAPLRARLLEELTTADTNTSPPLELRVKLPDGRWRHLEAVVADLNDNPSVAGTVINARDITERKRAEADLEHLALHDGLTGLPNRVLFLDRLEQAIAQKGSGPAEGPAVLFMDLDRFKLVNDGLGHEVGDDLLAQVGERLRKAMRPGDTVARFGGDEFVALCPGVTGPATAVAAGERLLACFAEPFAIGGDLFAVSASLGVALHDGTSSASDLLRHADEAMYRAKARGRNRVEIFDETAREDALLRIHTETSLRRALDGDELRVHYQPVIDIATMEPVGVEALVRWQHPTGGLLAPADFIGVAEESGLIVPVGAWVLQEACRQVVEWNDARAGGPPLSLNVNLSARQLAEPGLVACVREVMARHPGGADRLPLALEVTETYMLRDPETAEVRLAELRRLGVRLAIDDFGTGYSSLSYLRRFPFSTVKIDREFVAGLGASVEDEAIVRAVVQLARSLDLQVIAEGVETEVQLDRLRALGCELAQGYLLARPVPADAFGPTGPVRPGAAPPLAALPAG